MDETIFRPALRRLVDALEAEFVLSDELHGALVCARNTLRGAERVATCPHCANGVLRVAFNRRHFHEQGDDLMACTATESETV
jgi:hypothetical protein